MKLSTLCIRDNTRFVFQSSKSLARVIFVRSHKIVCVEIHLDDLLRVGSKLCIHLEYQDKKMNYMVTIAWVLECCFAHIRSIRTSGTMARWSHRLVQEAFLCYRLRFGPMESRTQSDDLLTGLTIDLSGTQSYGLYRIRTNCAQLALGISVSTYSEGGLSQSITQMELWDMS